MKRIHSEAPTGNLDVLYVAGRGVTWSETAPPSASGLLDAALQLSEAEDSPRTAVIVGEDVELLRRTAAARHGRARRWWLARVAGIPDDRETATQLAELAWVARRAGGRIGPFAIAVSDVTLEDALLHKGRGLALVARRDEGEQIAYLARPDLDPNHGPSWSGDEVRQRQDAHLPAALGFATELERKRRAGLRALLDISRERYGWAILPRRMIAVQSDVDQLAKRGLRPLAPLHEDPLFCRYRLPSGWLLEPGSEERGTLLLRDAFGVPRLEVVYDAGSAQEAARRAAFMRLF